MSSDDGKNNEKDKNNEDIDVTGSVSTANDKSYTIERRLPKVSIPIIFISFKDWITSPVFLLFCIFIIWLIAGVPIFMI